MTSLTEVRKPTLSHGLVAGILLLWLIYSAVNIALVGDPIVDLLGLLLGALGLWLLIRAGFSPSDSYLRFEPLSRSSLLVYLILAAGVVGSMLPFFQFHGLDAGSLLLHAPLSAIAQELFFRAVLLSALSRVLQPRDGVALVLHALLFGVWHAGVFRFAPLSAGVMVVLVPTLCGLVWGWQVRRDGTLVWAVVHHTLLQMFMRLSAWG